MNIFRHTSGLNTFALIFFSFVAIASGCFDTFCLDIPNEICQISTLFIFIVAIRIFSDCYKSASLERAISRAEAEDLVCLARRKSGICPLIRQSCMQYDCCQKRCQSANTNIEDDVILSQSGGLGPQCGCDKK